MSNTENDLQDQRNNNLQDQRNKNLQGQGNTNLHNELNENSKSEEQHLLDFIDIKYFKNNPDYIKKWQDYFYSQDSDIKILFLMKYKKVSTEYHWIYLEMAKFFYKKNKCGISSYILEDALKNGVYDPQVLKKELDSYKNVKTVSPGEAYRYLNPTGFTALGRIWNELKIETFYDQNIYKGDISFEEYRILSFKPKIPILKNQIVIKHKLEFIDNSKREKISNFRGKIEMSSVSPLKLGFSQSETDIHEIYENEIHENDTPEKEIPETDLEVQEIKCDEQEIKCDEQEIKCDEQEIKCDEQELKCDEQELKCDEQELSVDTQELIKELNENDDFKNKNCTQEFKDDIQEFNVINKGYTENNQKENTINNNTDILNTNDNYQVEYIYSTQDIDLHTIYLSKENDFLVSLKEVFESSPDLIKLYYIKKAFELTISSNLDIESLDDFYVNTDFEIKSHKKNLSNHKLILSKLFNIFSDFIEPDVCLDDLLENIEGVLNSQNFKRVMYKYQIYVYENIHYNFNL